MPGAPLKTLFIAALAATIAVGASCVPCSAGEVVAVFNFAQRDDDPQYTWLSKGLADLLINQLSNLPDITVVSRDRMQSLLAEYQRVINRPRLDADTQLGPVAIMLEANRMIFGTYGVEADRVTMTAQVIRIKDQKVLFEARASGDYALALETERELARQLRANLLGQEVDKMPVGDVPQWTTTLSAAEHLYAGVDLFDEGEYAEAWLRFRQAARVDAGYADATYWQGRMLYYLMQYENARLILDAFFTRWPEHPRAGDAAIELLDSYRQTTDDAATLRHLYAQLRRHVAPETMVYNKSTPGVETRTVLKTYIGGFQVQAERALGNFDAAADLALALQEESRQAFDRSDLVDESRWGFFDDLALYTAMERRIQGGPIRLNKGMFRRFMHGQIVHQFPVTGSYVRWPGGPRKRPQAVRVGNKYRLVSIGFCNGWLIAPDGHEFTSIRVSAKFHHEPGSQPFTLTASLGSWTRSHHGQVIGTTDQGEGSVELELPHACRVCYVWASIVPPHYGAWGGLDLLVDEPPGDYVQEVLFTVKFQPLPKEAGRIRVVLENVEKAHVLLDGKTALMSDGIIHSVTPGPHKILALPARGAKRQPSAIYDPVEKQVTVRADETVTCHFRFPFNPMRATTLWSSPVKVAQSYPEAKLPPWNGGPEYSRPCLIRVERGPLTGRLVALWSFREEFWLSYSADDGRTWAPPKRMPIPVNSAHQELAPQLIQDEQGRFVLLFCSDRNIERAFYPYVTWSKDLELWQPPRKLANLVCDKLRFKQDQQGRYVVFAPPTYSGRDWVKRLERVGENEWRQVQTDVATEFAKKYARRTVSLLTSLDLRDWHEADLDFGADFVRDADFVQTADGRFHAVYLEVTQEPGRDPIYRLMYRASNDLARWGVSREVVGSTWAYTNPVLATDGQRVYGSLSISGNNTHWFEIGETDVTGWWGFASERNTLFHDSPVFGNRLHWLWLAFESTEECYIPHPGRVYYSQRPSDRGEWLFRAPKTRPPDTELVAREKRRVLKAANTVDSQTSRPWKDPRTYTSEQLRCRITVPTDWTKLDDPRGRVLGFVAPQLYGAIEPAVEIMAFPVHPGDDLDNLAAMAERRWLNMSGRYINVDRVTHPCGADAYLITYETDWVNQEVLARQYGLVVGGKEYRIGYRCPLEAAEKWVPVLNRILDSFVFTGTSEETKRNQEAGTP